jgi:hypothetical protein
MAAASIYKSPDVFSFKATEWEAWIVSWKRYRKLTKIDKEDDETQIDALIYHLGTQKAENIMATFKNGKKTAPNPAHAKDAEAPAMIQVDEKATVYADVLSKFQNHFVPKVNIVNESAVFNKRKQGVDECADDFIIDLQRLVLTCDYQDADRQVRDRFIAGLRDEKLQEKLQFMSKVDLTTAVDYAKRWEMVQEQMKKQRDTEARAANEIRAPHRARGRGRGGRGRGGRGRGWGRGRGGSDSNQSGQSQPTEDKCGRCGFMYHKKKSCPALHQQCKKCSKRGHLPACVVVEVLQEAGVLRKMKFRHSTTKTKFKHITLIWGLISSTTSELSTVLMALMAHGT